MNDLEVVALSCDHEGRSVILAVPCVLQARGATSSWVRACMRVCVFVCKVYVSVHVCLFVFVTDLITQVKEVQVVGRSSRLLQDTFHYYKFHTFLKGSAYKGNIIS